MAKPAIRVLHERLARMEADATTFRLADQSVVDEFEEQLTNTVSAVSRKRNAEASTGAPEGVRAVGSAKESASGD